MNDCEAAAAAGDPDALRRARSLGCEWGNTAAFAIRRGPFIVLDPDGTSDVLRWARRAGCPFTPDTYRALGSHGSPQLLDWVRGRFPFARTDELAAKTAHFAASHGSMDVLIWCVEHGARDWKDVAFAAAQGGRIEVMEWMRERGHPLWDGSDANRAPTICDAAAHGGKLEALRWLRAAGAPWTARTCSLAARNGHLDVLRWARERVPPCPWDSDTVLEADRWGHTAVLEWAIAHGCGVGFLARLVVKRRAVDALRPLLHPVLHRLMRRARRMTKPRGAGDGDVPLIAASA